MSGGTEIGLLVRLGAGLAVRGARRGARHPQPRRRARQHTLLPRPDSSGPPVLARACLRSVARMPQKEKKIGVFKTYAMCSLHAARI